MMRGLRVLLAACAMMSLLASCGSLGKLFHRKPKVSKEPKKDMFIGVVEIVNPEQRFVLVRLNVNLKLAVGTSLEARSPNGAKATLNVTPERKLNYLSADIADGLPQRGDFVILAAASQTETPTPEATPQDITVPTETLPKFDAPGEMTPGVAPTGIAPSSPNAPLRPPQRVPGSSVPMPIGPSSNAPTEPLPPVVR